MSRCVPVETLPFEDVKTDLSSTAAPKAFEKAGGYFVALGDFRGVEITYHGGDADWMPMHPGSVWVNPGNPESDTPEDAPGDEYSGRFRLKIKTGARGKLVLALFGDEATAREFAKNIAGVGAPSNAPAEYTATEVSVVATGAAAEFTRDSATRRMILKADEDNTAAVFVAETQAKATAAAGWELYQGAELEWFGPLFTFSVAAQTLRVAEYQS